VQNVVDQNDRCPLKGRRKGCGLDGVHDPPRVHIIAVHGNVDCTAERGGSGASRDGLGKPVGKLDSPRGDSNQRDIRHIRVLGGDAIRDPVDCRG
jgi:hypothetical protein